MQKLITVTVFFRKVLTEIASWTVLASTVLITIDVILRYLVQGSIPGNLEINCVLLAIMVFFSLGQVQADKEHIRVDFFVDKLPAKAKDILEIIVYLVAIVFFSLLFWESIGFFLTSFAIKEIYASVVDVPIYPAKAAIFLGCGLMIIELIKDLALLLTKKDKSIPRTNGEKVELKTIVDN